MKYRQPLNSLAAKMPALTFAPIPGTNMDQLAPQFGPQYKEHGTVGVVGLFRPWIGCARRGDDLIFMNPGGHNDSNFNGDFAYNRRTRQWRMLHLPSDYTDPIWAESVALYGGSRANINISERYDPHGDLVWKDGRPCSTHSWGLMVDAEEFGVFHVRNGIWRFDPVTNQKTKLSNGAFWVPSDSYAFYSKAKKKIYLCADDSASGVYGRIWEVDPTTGTVTITGLTVKQWYTGDACELEGGGKAYYYSVYWNLAYLVDFDVGTVISKPPLSFGSDGLVTFMHSNKTGLLALRVSGMLATVDVATGTIANVGASGIPASLLAVSAVANGVWGRCKLMTNETGQCFTFPIETNADVYEMVI